MAASRGSVPPRLPVPPRPSAARPPASRPSSAPRPAAPTERWFGLKQQIHTRLLTQLTPDQLRTLNKDGVREQVGNVVERMAGEERIPMPTADREKLIEDVLDEVFGLGPLEPLLKDPT